MSREIRKVNIGWEHPERDRIIRRDYDGKEFIPLSEYNEEHKCDCEYCDVNSSDGYMPKIKKPFGYCLYESVSEGTPITPVFKTKEKLKDYLIENGDFWGNEWDEKSVEIIVEDEYAPSIIMTGGKIYSPNEIGNISNK